VRRETEVYDVVVPDVAGEHSLNIFVVDAVGDASSALERTRTPVASLRLLRGGKG
jgi:hypothetical protein